MADRDRFILTSGLLDNDFIVVRVEMKKEPAAMFLFWSRFSPTFLLRRFSRSSRNLFDLLGWCWYRGLHGRRLWSRPRSLRRTFLWGLDGTFASLFRFLVGSVGWSL